jgi:quinol monooxygenase YgiN
MASTPGISLHVTIYIDPSNVEKFFEHMKPVYDAVVAEPECRFFEIYQDPKEPGTLSWVENWYFNSILPRG